MNEHAPKLSLEKRPIKNKDKCYA